MVIWHFPVLPVKNRYPEEWFHQFPEEYEKHKSLEYVSVLPDDDHLFSVPFEKGHGPADMFTDFNASIRWELGQIRNFMNQYRDKIRPKDVVFFCDIDFPGFVAPFAHLIKTQLPDVKIYGYLHAGSYCKDDLFCNTPGKLQTEIAYLATFDGVFVGSEYHKNKFCGLIPRSPGESQTLLADKVHVVGAPFYKSQLRGVEGKRYDNRKFDVIYPSRIDLQKKADTFLGLVNRFPDIKFVCTHNPGICPPNLEYQHPEGREGYYKLLADSRTCLSLAKEETFGYIALEAMAVGTVPIGPANYSYPEILKDMWATMYTRDEGIPLAIRQAMEMTMVTINPFWYSRVDEMEQSIPKMIRVMLGE